MSRVLVTGFGPFPGVPDNPSEALVRGLDASSPVDAHVLPVEWEACASWAERVELDGTAAIIQLGVSTSASTMRLERFAYNEASIDRVDDAGRLLGRASIAAHEPTRLESEVDCDALLRGLSPHLTSAVTVSEDPGRYLCNFVYFLTLSRARSLGVPALFVHVPPFATANVGRDVQGEALREILELVQGGV